MLDPGRKPGGLGWVITCPGKGHSSSSHCPSAPPFFPLLLLPQPSTRKLQSILSRVAGKSLQPNAPLIVQAAIHLTSNSNIILFKRLPRIRIGPAHFHKPPDNGPISIIQCLSLYPGINILEGVVPGRVGVCLTSSLYIHQAHAKPISHCQNGACGILSPREAVTEQVLFHYPLSGQSLILPLCSSVMLFISVVCTHGFHISGFPCRDLNPFEPGFGQTVELLRSFFLNN